jgi:hypothetical protein
VVVVDVEGQEAKASEESRMQASRSESWTARASERAPCATDATVVCSRSFPPWHCTAMLGRSDTLGKDVVEARARIRSLHVHAAGDVSRCPARSDSPEVVA